MGIKRGRDFFSTLPFQHAKRFSFSEAVRTEVRSALRSEKAFDRKRER